MAARDPKAFQSFLAPDTVFGMGRNPAMGIEAVMKVWLPFFEGPKAPFSWKPDFVMLAPTGELAYSSGPVYNPEGKLINRFHSTWRRKAGGGWEIVFDQGEAVCGT
jgi:ketosteroid isomerase-like protein